MKVVSYGTRYRWMCMAKAEKARNSQEAIENGRLMQLAADRAKFDLDEKYPQEKITPENISEALKYQKERIEFRRKELGV